MREELVIERPRAEQVPPIAEWAAPPRHPRRRIDRFELGVLGVFALLSLWVLGLDAWQVIVHGRVWTGTDGVYIVDQMQYLAWIKEASRHVLVANLFVLRPTPADYFQPAVVVSGALAAAGVPLTIALLLWKPVAVVAAFLAMRAYIHRSLPGLWPRRLALTLALLFGSVTVAYGSVTTLGDLSPVFLSWGYTFGLLALACIIGALVIYERSRASGSLSLWPAVLGACASLLHPWHGELLALVLILTELWLWLRRRRGGVALPLLTLAGTGLPLAYYAILGRSDLSWHLARDASKHSFSLWPIALYLLPLALPALLALRRPARTFLSCATRLWLAAALILYVLSATALGATPLHAFEGITLPLAVLAVQGVADLRPSRLRLGGRRVGPALVAAAVLLLTVPGLILQMNSAKQLATPTWDNANFIEPSENAALDYLARSRLSGTVLTRSYLGAVVPERTGRRTLIGDCMWSEPGCMGRTDIAQELFSGELGADAARWFADRTRARFVLADCKTQANLRQLLGPMIVRVTRFGCAEVLQLRYAGKGNGPLTNLPTYAAVRAQRRQ